MIGCAFISSQAPLIQFEKRFVVTVIINATGHTLPMNGGAVFLEPRAVAGILEIKIDGEHCVGCGFTNVLVCVA